MDFLTWSTLYTSVQFLVFLNSLMQIYVTFSEASLIIIQIHLFGLLEILTCQTSTRTPVASVALCIFLTLLPEETTSLTKQTVFSQILPHCPNNHLHLAQSGHSIY